MCDTPFVFPKWDIYMVTTNTSYGIANFTYDVKTNGVEHTLILGEKKKELKNNSPHLDFDFNLLTLFKLFFYLKN